MRNGKEKREGKAEGKGDEWDGVEKGRKGHPPHMKYWIKHRFAQYIGLYGYVVGGILYWLYWFNRGCQTQPCKIN